MIDCLRRLVLPFAALLSALTLSSCLEQYSEEMVIHADLSGEATVTVGLPDSLLDKFDAVQTAFSEANIRKRFAKVSGVKLEEYTITEGRHPEATFHVTFSSLEKLSEAAKDNAPAQILIGQFTVSKEGDHTVVERKLGVGTPTMSLPADKNALYKTHFDMPVEIAHTDSGFYDKSHGDLRYKWTMANIAAERPSMVNKLVKPLPWLWIGLSTVGAVVVAWFCWQGLRNMKRKKLYAASMPPPAPALTKAPTPTPGAKSVPSPTPQGPAQPQRPGMPPRPGPPRRPGK